LRDFGRFGEISLGVGWGITILKGSMKLNWNSQKGGDWVQIKTRL